MGKIANSNYSVGLVPKGTTPNDYNSFLTNEQPSNSIDTGKWLKTNDDISITKTFPSGQVVKELGLRFIKDTVAGISPPRWVELRGCTEPYVVTSLISTYPRAHGISSLKSICYIPKGYITGLNIANQAIAFLSGTTITIKDPHKLTTLQTISVTGLASVDGIALKNGKFYVYSVTDSKFAEVGLDGIAQNALTVSGMGAKLFFIPDTGKFYNITSSSIVCEDGTSYTLSMGGQTSGFTAATWIGDYLAIYHASSNKMFFLTLPFSNGKAESFSVDMPYGLTALTNLAYDGERIFFTTSSLIGFFRINDNMKVLDYFPKVINDDKFNTPLGMNALFNSALSELGGLPYKKTFSHFEKMFTKLNALGVKWIKDWAYPVDAYQVMSNKSLAELETHDWSTADWSNLDWMMEKVKQNNMKIYLLTDTAWVQTADKIYSNHFADAYYVSLAKCMAQLAGYVASRYAANYNGYFEFTDYGETNFIPNITPQKYVTYFEIMYNKIKEKNPDAGICPYIALGTTTNWLTIIEELFKQGKGHMIGSAIAVSLYLPNQTSYQAAKGTFPWIDEVAPGIGGNTTDSLGVIEQLKELCRSYDRGDIDVFIIETGFKNDYESTTNDKLDRGKHFIRMLDITNKRLPFMPSVLLWCLAYLPVGVPWNGVSGMEWGMIKFVDDAKANTFSYTVADFYANYVEFRPYTQLVQYLNDPEIAKQSLIMHNYNKNRKNGPGSLPEGIVNVKLSAGDNPVYRLQIRAGERV